MINDTNDTDILLSEEVTGSTIFIKNNQEIYSLARWAALYESINMIADKAEERNVDFNSVELKPLKILEYIDDTSDIIMRKLLENKKNNNLIENWQEVV